MRILLVLLLAMTNAFAFNHGIKKGVRIVPEKVSAKYNSGDSASFKGEICVVSWDEGHKGSKCHRITDKALNIRAFFPDATTEVTDQLIFQRRKKKKGIGYEFQSPSLESNSPNTFTLVIGKSKTEVDKLLKVQAKLEKRIAYLKEKKSSAWADKFIAKLEKVSANITKILEEDPDVLAKMQIPLQVDNSVAAPFYYSAMMSGYKMSLQLPIGSLIEGENTEVISRVMNLSSRSFWFPMTEDDHEDKNDDAPAANFQSILSFNGAEILNLDNQSIVAGESVENSSLIGPLNPNAPNDLAFSLYYSKESHHKKHSKKFLKGSISYSFPVAADTVAPVWSIISPEESSIYLASFPEIKARLSDDFGHIDQSSISLKVFYNDQEFDKSDKFVFGADGSVSASLSDIGEGSYKVALSGSDYAGNTAQNEQIQFVIDCRV